MCWSLRLMQLSCTCMAFSLVADMGIQRGDIGTLSLFFWCSCFALTLIISIVELCRLPSRFRFFWYNFPITYACYAALTCFSASITYCISYVQFLPDGPYRDRAVAATAFSGIACVLYAIEVTYMWDCYSLDEITCYVHTVPGLLKVLETFVSGFTFGFLSNTNLYLHQPALVWCVAVYSICFISAAVVLLLNMGKGEHRPAVNSPIFQAVLTLLSVLLYVSALVLWPLYQFYEEFGGQPQRSSDRSCTNGLTYYVCSWDQRLSATILTAINLLIYVADVVYWARQVSAGTEDVPSAPDPLCSPEVSLQSSDVL
ncbi:myeloid-associated differentiation marker-like [Hippopotamus amphibius kiboko]|uniref:myeloid-associated differentiation marker-like n=1 Tax=Hippopotamus amphibius kiboko TaxID=575201 RepID=UPI0025938033|nr:myeloid-associated differentiation marker-like [Hippopotamus amphibius kiboko]